MSKKQSGRTTKRRLVIIGLGGIGSWAVQTVAPILAFRPESERWNLVLVDGDKYEQKNLSRQAFDLQDCGDFKATVQARWVHRRFGDKLDVESVSMYVTDGSSVIADGDIVLLAVDNHKTRKMVSDFCESLDNVWLVSAGNELYDGNVQVFGRKNRRNVSPPLGQYHPEIAEPKDKSPNEKSCEELAFSEPQLIATNLMAASLAINALWDIIEGRTAAFEETYFDILNNVAVGKRRQL